VSGGLPTVRAAIGPHHPPDAAGDTVNDGNRTLNARITSLLIAALICLSGTASSAELPGIHPLLYKRFTLGVGGFFPQVDSKIRLDSDLGPGTELDFENVLGLEESKSTFWLSGRWRIGARHTLELEASRLNRNASQAAVTDEIIIDDTVLQAGGVVDSTFDIDLVRATYGFSLVRNERTDLQLQAGLHIADISASLTLEGVISIDGQPFTETFSTEGSDVTAPLPHFGVQVFHAFSERFGVYANLIGFALKISDIEGQIIESGATLQYNVTENFGLGAGVRYFGVNVEGSGEDLRGKFDFDYFGPVAYANWAF
jgi:hypothetical protein